MFGNENLIALSRCINAVLSFYTPQRMLLVNQTSSQQSAERNPFQHKELRQNLRRSAGSAPKTFDKKRQ